MKKKLLIFTLVLALVFSLTLGTVASALNIRDTGSGLTEDEQIQRGLMWEELNSLVNEINECFLSENVTGNYFTSYYFNTLIKARDYAVYLLDTVGSTYQQLSDMSDDLRYLISESDNPANHELAFHCTVAFTNTQNWDDPIYVYAWSKSGIQEFSWPGMGLTSSYKNEFGQKQYYAYIGEEYDYVIFSSSSGAQTVDIPLYDKTGYYPTGEVDAKGNHPWKAEVTEGSSTVSLALSGDVTTATLSEGAAGIKAAADETTGVTVIEISAPGSYTLAGTAKNTYVTVKKSITDVNLTLDGLTVDDSGLAAALGEDSPVISFGKSSAVTVILANASSLIGSSTFVKEPEAVIKASSAKLTFA